MSTQSNHTKKIDRVIAKYGSNPGALLGILEEVQQLNCHKYLPQETLEYISQKTNIPLAKIYGVVTFYAFFNLKPQGDHTIIICRGTACHTRRSKNILEYLKQLLGLKEEGHHQGEKLFLTTADNKFTLRTVACFGQCALAPVVEVDGVIYGHMTESKLRQIVQGIARKKKK
ncbi:MAG: NAD(P)H-dependent oxidoreductase subunit E [Candidatus Omnitrophica bacterium]|nr:NAD(P)H-dependent oxidoreductase subunit E [Candidatus Omnitrophota bacterium]